MVLLDALNDREFVKFEEVAGTEVVKTSARTFAFPLNQRRDDISSLLYYIGEAANLSATEADPLWRIYRYSKIGTITTVDYALDGKFEAVWDDRYTYFGANPFTNPFSVNFLNANDYVNIGNVAGLDFAGSSPFSISSWSKNSVTTERVIFSKQGAGTASGYRYYLQSNAISLLISGGTGAADRIEIRSSNLSINNGSWHHCVVTYDGSGSAAGVRFYHNGVLDPTGGYTTTANALVGTVTNTTAAQISGRNGTTNIFQGNLNNVSVWNKALSALEVAEFYATTHPTDLSTHSAVADLLGWWVLYDEQDIGLFPQFSDRSASNYDGTGVNMSLTQINIDVP